MNKLLTAALIPTAAFAVTVTGVSAFNGEVLEEVGLNESQIEAFSEAHELREAGEWEDAREVLEEAGIDRSILREVHQAMHEHRSEVRSAIESAVDSGDYRDFLDAIENTPLEDAIDDEEDFELFIEASELREDGDFEGAKAIFDELGIERPEHGHGKPMHRSGEHKPFADRN